MRSRTAFAMICVTNSRSTQLIDQTKRECAPRDKSCETEQRLYELSVWREAPFYSDRERAALAWTEAVTLVAQTHVPDDVYAEAKRQFAEAGLVNLTVAITLINCWNRLNIAFRKVPGEYKPNVQQLKMTA